MANKSDTIDSQADRVKLFVCQVYDDKSRNESESNLASLELYLLSTGFILKNSLLNLLNYCMIEYLRESTAASKRILDSYLNAAILGADQVELCLVTNYNIKRQG